MCHHFTTNISVLNGILIFTLFFDTAVQFLNIFQYLAPFTHYSFLGTACILFEVFFNILWHFFLGLWQQHVTYNLCVAAVREVNTSVVVIRFSGGKYLEYAFLGCNTTVLMLVTNTLDE